MNVVRLVLMVMLIGYLPEMRNKHFIKLIKMIGIVDYFVKCANLLTALQFLARIVLFQYRFMILRTDILSSRTKTEGLDF